MNERIYQGVVGVLVVAVSVASYQLYKKESPVNVTTNVAKGVDIAAIKPKYQYISSKELLMQQQRRNNFEKVKLNASLVELRNSTQKSMQMIKDYNEKYPNNPITQEFEFNALQDSNYDFDTVQVQPSSKQVQKGVKETNKRLELAQEGITSNYGGATGSYGGSSQTNKTSTEASQQTNKTTASKSKKTTPSTEKEVDVELVAYQASINDITKVIEQINNNLN
ncbi:hypothetical protein [Sulfurimonas sp.]|uniref:hypothetical protein n=1 Tax=Sulfurimonas sp. TaxID=2022749 RepID=UPI002AB035A1|nr:hypothetical protein [Sulfurimonas sp.]